MLTREMAQDLGMRGRWVSTRGRRMGEAYSGMGWVGLDCVELGLDWVEVGFMASGYGPGIPMTVSHERIENGGEQGEGLSIAIGCCSCWISPRYVLLSPPPLCLEILTRF